MIHKTPAPQANHLRVVFELPASLWADRVYVVGDFNGWQASATPLHQDHEGVWRATVDLPLDANHEFYYWVDGTNHTDFYADDWSKETPNAPAGKQCALDRATYRHLLSLLTTAADKPFKQGVRSPYP